MFTGWLKVKQSWQMATWILHQPVLMKFCLVLLLSQMRSNPGCLSLHLLRTLMEHTQCIQLHLVQRIKGMVQSTISSTLGVIHCLTCTQLLSSLQQKMTGMPSCRTCKRYFEQLATLQVLLPALFLADQDTS